jgi:hypothetical protein
LGDQPGGDETLKATLFAIIGTLLDVARFAGQDVTLTFSGPFGQTNSMLPGWLQAEARLDGIQLVTTAAPLGFRRAGNEVTFAWPASIFGYSLQTAQWPLSEWRNVVAAPVVVGDQQTVTVGIGNTNLFFRLGLIQGRLMPPSCCP